MIQIQVRLFHCGAYVLTSIYFLFVLLVILLPYPLYIVTGKADLIDSQIVLQQKQYRYGICLSYQYTIDNIGMHAL